MTRSITISFLFFFCLATGGEIFSQEADDTDVQSWNDLQISIPVANKIDLQILSTARIGNNLSQFREGRIGAGISVDIGKGFSAATNYLLIGSRNSHGNYTSENRFTFRGGYKFPLKKIGLSHRSTYEYRIRSNGNSWRYRAAMTVEKKLPDKWMKDAEVFLTEEVFYVSTEGRFARNRVSAGISKKLNRNLTLDIYYMRQNDGTTRPGDLNVIGTTWRVHL